MSWTTPPIPALRTLQFLLGDERGVSIAWDLHDLYEHRLATSSHRIASVRFWLDAASIAVRPKLWRTRTSTYRSVMIANHFRTATRQLRRHPGFSGLTVVGLGVGLACVLLIFTFLRHEWSYDTHHPDSDRLYRVTLEDLDDNTHWASIGPPVGPALLESFPEVAETARVFALQGSTLFRVGNRQFLEANGTAVDPSFFDIFGYRFLEGDKQTALDDPRSLVISETLARKYFDRTDVVGESIELPPFGPLTVSGVFATPDTPSHLTISFMESLALSFGPETRMAQSRTWAGMLTYVRLVEGAPVAALENRLPEFVDSFYAGLVPGSPRNAIQMHLQPVESIHLHSNLEKEFQANGSAAAVYIFSVVALFILLIAAVNAMNLTTARATSRLSETAVRKTFGARRMQLVNQLMVESLLQSGLAMLLAAVLFVVALPVFTGLTNLAVTWRALLEPDILAVLVGSSLTIGFLAGLWPALLISSFSPIDGLRGSRGMNGGAATVRKGLVVLQFAVSIFLIAGATIVWQQLTHALTADLGFDRDQTLLVDLTEEGSRLMTENPETLRNALLSHPNVVAVSQTSNVPGERYSMESFRIEGSTEDEDPYMRVSWTADHDIVDALGLKLIAGRSFSRHEPMDSTAWVINASAAKRFGHEPADIIGKVVEWGSRYSGPVVGVVEDFNIFSFHRAVEPLVIPLRPTGGGKVVLRFADVSPVALVADVESIFNEVLPGELFSYQFMDDRMAALYDQDQRLRSIITWFSGLAILVACLGLFGLAAYSVTRRTPEIGVRKVLGASMSDIVRLVSQEYVLLVGVAFVLAAPITWIALSRWLDTFAYKLDLTIWPVLVAGLLALVFAIMTVGGHAFKASNINPATAIKRD